MLGKDTLPYSAIEKLLKFLQISFGYRRISKTFNLLRTKTRYRSFTLTTPKG